MKTADREFLKAAHIEPCDIAEPRWMAWRDEEIDSLRMSVANWIVQCREESKRVEFWKLWAFAGWFAATMLFMIPVIERWTAQ